MLIIPKINELIIHSKIMTDRDKCFIIMPFSETSEKHNDVYWTKHYEGFLKPLIEENTSISASRVNELRGDILLKIITELVTSQIVIADLTDENPNVFWELGIRQSFKHGTITIAEKGTELPFDLSLKNTIFYDKDKFNDKQFKSKFLEAVQDCLDNPKRPDSHVLSNLSGRGSLFEIFHRDETIRRIDAILEDIDYNYYLIKDFYSKRKYNKKKLEWFGKISTAPLMRWSSLELLLTNRYIDADKNFYDNVSNYHHLIKGLNLKFDKWQHNAKQIEKTLFPFEQRILSTSKSFSKDVKNIRDDLIKKC
jgi:hypothetical protein